MDILYAQWAQFDQYLATTSSASVPIPSRPRQEKEAAIEEELPPPSTEVSNRKKGGKKPALKCASKHQVSAFTASHRTEQPNNTNDKPKSSKKIIEGGTGRVDVVRKSSTKKISIDRAQGLKHNSDGKKKRKGNSFTESPDGTPSAVASALRTFVTSADCPPPDPVAMVSQVEEEPLSFSLGNEASLETPDARSSRQKGRRRKVVASVSSSLSSRESKANGQVAQKRKGAENFIDLVDSDDDDDDWNSSRESNRRIKNGMSTNVLNTAKHVFNNAKRASNGEDSSICNQYIVSPLRTMKKKPVENVVTELISVEESIGEIVCNTKRNDDSDVDMHIVSDLETIGGRTRRSSRTHMGGCVACCPATEISIDNETYEDSCCLYYQPSTTDPSFTLEYQCNMVMMKNIFVINRDINGIQFYIPEETKLSSDCNDAIVDVTEKTSVSNARSESCYLILRIAASPQTGLLERNIIVETKDRKSFVDMTTTMHESVLLVKCLRSSDANQGNLNASLSTIANQRHSRREGPSPKYKADETVLVFPFRASNATLYYASKGMTEAHGAMLQCRRL